MSANPQLHCPVRGALTAKLKASDGLTFTEEKRRIECISKLLECGYPADRIEAETVVVRFGHKGKNSLRADVVVYDRPVKDIGNLSADERRSHMRIIAEIKRSSADAASAIDDQLKPALTLIPSTSAVGIYWDDVEQLIFFKEVNGTHIAIKEASIASLPPFGAVLKMKELHLKDLNPTSDLTAKFGLLDDILHQAGHSKDDRYEILFKVLLLKIYDEQRAKPKNGRMVIQDFTLSEIDDAGVLKIFEGELASALIVYGNHLPKKPTKTLDISGATARQISRVLCGINILDSSPQVLQEFFMYFGNLLYKADLAQYFTPYEVIDFIVRTVNPSFGDVVKDPACGTADFLVAAKRIGEERHGADISAQLYGVDTAAMAVNLSVFNMILNGDGRSNITLGDSLKDISQHEEKYTVALCNPPFGTKILERRPEVLKQFELGHEGGNLKGPVLEAQETGILFVEVCLRSVKPGGRIGIILPNGYLGNRSARYKTLREWLLRRAKIAAVVGFPRFTFKRSGADVSASVVVMERLPAPVAELDDVGDYPIHFNLVDKVGWDLQSNRAGRVYKRSEVDGAILLDAGNEPILDADFDRVLGELYSSTAVDAFPWLASGVPGAGTGAGWIVQASEIFGDDDLIVDPKRRSKKLQATISNIKQSPHITLGDILEPAQRKFTAVNSDEYDYVEIEQIYENFGSYVTQRLRGWALPSRAKLKAKAGDFFIANIWSSAGKWMMAGDEAADGRLIVTTGCTQFQVKPGAEALIPDLIFGLSSEAFRVQMRGLATGSDGLSSVTVSDILSVVLPKIPNADLRKTLEARVAEAKSGHLALPKLVAETIKKELPSLVVGRRSSHVAQV